MIIKEYLKEEYQDYFRVVSKSACLRDLDNEFIMSYYPKISVTRDKNYYLNSDEYSKENQGGFKGASTIPFVRYTIDANKLRSSFKVVPYKNPAHTKMNPKVEKSILAARARYEAEEIVFTDKIPVSFIKEILLLKDSNEIEKKAKELNIPVTKK